MGANSRLGPYSNKYGMLNYMIEYYKLLPDAERINIMILQWIATFYAH